MTAGRDSAWFAKDIDPATAGTLTYDPTAHVRLTRLLMRIYDGAALAVTLDPYILEPDGTRRRLGRRVGKTLFDGDSDEWPINLSDLVEPGDVICIDYSNADPGFVRSFAALLDYDKLPAPVALWARAGGGRR